MSERKKASFEYQGATIQEGSRNLQGKDWNIMKIMKMQLNWHFMQVVSATCHCNQFGIRTGMIGV